MIAQQTKAVYDHKEDTLAINRDLDRLIVNDRALEHFLQDKSLWEEVMEMETKMEEKKKRSTYQYSSY